MFTIPTAFLKIKQIIIIIMFSQAYKKNVSVEMLSKIRMPPLYGLFDKVKH